MINIFCTLNVNDSRMEICIARFFVKTLICQWNGHLWHFVAVSVNKNWIVDCRTPRLVLHCFPDLKILLWSPHSRVSFTNHPLKTKTCRGGSHMDIPLWHTKNAITPQLPLCCRATLLGISFCFILQPTRRWLDQSSVGWPKTLKTLRGRQGCWHLMTIWLKSKDKLFSRCPYGGLTVCIHIHYATMKVISCVDILINNSLVWSV